MKRTFWSSAGLLLVVSLCLGVVASTAEAQPWRGQRGGAGINNGQQGFGPGPRRGGPRGPGAHLMRAIRSLDLTDEQQDTLKGLMQEHREEMKAQRESIKTAHEAYGAVLTNPDADSDDLDEAETALKELHEVMAESLFALARQVRDVLTEEQLEELGEKLNNPPERPQRQQRPQARRRYNRRGNVRGW